MGRILQSAAVLAFISWIFAGDVQAVLSSFVGPSILLGDSDGDGLSDLEELRLGTHPGMADSDLDHLPDLFELEIGFDPTSHDASARFAVAEPGGYGLEFRAGDRIVRLQTFFDRPPQEELTQGGGSGSVGGGPPTVGAGKPSGLKDKLHRNPPPKLMKHICMQTFSIVPGSFTGCNGTPKCHHDEKVESASCRPFNHPEAYCIPSGCAATVGTVSSVLNPLCLIGCG